MSKSELETRIIVITLYVMAMRVGRLSAPASAPPNIAAEEESWRSRGRRGPRPAARLEPGPRRRRLEHAATHRTER